MGREEKCFAKVFLMAVDLLLAVWMLIQKVAETLFP